MSGTSQIIHSAGSVDSAGRWRGRTVSGKQSLPCIVKRRRVNRHIHQKDLPNNCLFFINKLRVSLPDKARKKCRVCTLLPAPLHNTGAQFNSPALCWDVFPCRIKRLVKHPNLSGLALKRQEIGLRQDACSFSSRGHKNPGGSRA